MMDNLANDCYGLAQVLCDSSSHINLISSAKERPCKYHMKRAKDAINLLSKLTYKDGKAIYENTNL